MQGKNQLLLSDEFSFDGFTAYLRTPAGGNRNKTTAISITSDLIKFFNVTAQSSRDTYSKIDRLFDKMNLESFLYHIKIEKNYKPTTITEKIRRLKLAIQYIMNLSTSQDRYSSGTSLLKLLTEMCHSLSQDVTEQCKGNSKYADTQNEYPSDVMVCKYAMHIINAAIIIT